MGKIKNKLLALVFIASLLVLPVSAYAVGSVAQSFTMIADGVYVLTITWIGDASGGLVPSTAITDSYVAKLIGSYLYSAVTNPGSPAPDDLYDIVINDADGFDIAGGLLANRSTSVTQMVNIGVGAIGYPVIRGPITFVLTGTTVNSATGTLMMLFVK